MDGVTYELWADGEDEVRAFGCFTADDLDTGAPDGQLAAAILAQIPGPPTGWPAGEMRLWRTVTGAPIDGPPAAVVPVGGAS